MIDSETGALEPDPRLPDTRRGHALADLVALAVNADESVSGGLSPHVVVTVPWATLQAQPGEVGHACAQTENGKPLSAAMARKMACDATVIPVVLGSSSEPLDVGRDTRTIPIGMRRALNARDRQCAFPGCTQPPRWADAHHIQHWADGGPTSLENLILLCRHHHDVIHHTGWTVTIKNGLPQFCAPMVRGHGRGRTPPRVA